MSQDVTRDGVQVHGGMGFIEETGAAQHYRDAKILTIYEGTTAIQANHLVGRKTVRDGGAVAKSIIAQVRATEAQLAGVEGADFKAMLTALSAGSRDLEAVVDYDANDGDAAFYQAKIATARFFADHILSQASGLRTAIVDGSAGVLALDVDQF